MTIGTQSDHGTSGLSIPQVLFCLLSPALRKYIIGDRPCDLYGKNFPLFLHVHTTECRREEGDYVSCVCICACVRPRETCHAAPFLASNARSAYRTFISFPALFQATRWARSWWPQCISTSS